MPPTSAGADVLVESTTGAHGLNQSLLRLAQLAVGTRPEAVLVEIASAVRLTAASLWQRSADPEGAVMDLVEMHTRPGHLASPADAPVAAVLARSPVALRTTGKAGGDAEAQLLHVAEIGLWREGQLSGCLRCERPSVFFEGELTFLIAAASHLAMLAESADRRHAEETLAERDLKLDEVEELTHLGSWEWDIASDTITWSAEQLRIHDVDADARTQTFGTFLERVHPKDRDRVVDECARTLTTGVPFAFPYRIVRGDGSEREMEALGKLLPGTRGRSARLVGISRDMTERNRAERALRASEESYRTIFENASDGIWVHDLRTGEVLDINAAAAAMFGYTRQEMLLVPHNELLYPGTEYTSARVASYMAQATAGETPRFEWLGRHRNGSEVWAEVTMRRVTIGGEDRILASARDIGGRKAAERALHRINEELEQRVAERTAELRRSEEHFRALIENSSDYIMIVDSAARITYVGPSVERLLGYPPDALIGLGPEQLVHPADHDRVYSALAEIVAHPGRVVTVEYRVRNSDGDWRLFENFGRTLRPDSPEAGVVANGRDITDRRRAEDEVARQKAYFEEILESIDAGISVFDPEGRFEYTTASAVTDPQVRRWVIGKTIEDYGRARNLPADVVMERRRSIEEAVATRTPNQFEQQVVCPDGTTRHMLRRLIPIENEAGEVARLVGYSVDITERKRVEVALQAAKEEAERANRAKSEFLSRMSHELRTPLNGILGFAQVLERRDARPDQETYIGHILKGGRHLLRLINEVLELSRIEAGRMSLSLEAIALEEVVREAMDLVRPLAEEGGHALELRVLSGPAAFVHADRQRLVQILLNLFSNAIKYNRPGGPVVIGCESRGEADGAGFSIRVEDRGKGIRGDRLDQLFTPFARLGAEQTDTEGTGLGLALSKRLAEAMSGDLVLEQTGPEGSTFRLDLRCASNPLQGAVERDSGADRQGDGAGPEATILYIEDNLTNLTLVETLFDSRPEWTTISALRGQAGLDLAIEQRPDLILLDLHLPDVSGDEVLRRLRADARTAAIPVIVISADATGAAMDRLRGAGADDYLTKPLDLEEFLATVERFLPG